VGHNVSRIVIIVVTQSEAYTGHIRNDTVIGEMKMNFASVVRLGIDSLTLDGRLLENPIT